MSITHIVGREISDEEDEKFYLQVQKWDNKSSRGKKQVVEIKQFSDNFWPETYQGLKRVVEISRPDLIFSDYQVEAARDVARENCIPLVMMWPQMPWLMVPQPWIPGQPGTQTRCLTSEKASYWDRIYDETYMLRWLPYLLKIQYQTRKIRRQAGVKLMPPMSKKPDYLLLVNSFFGIEPPKDLPPLLQVVGPVLADSYEPLNHAETKFFSEKHAVVYVAFGTHMIPTVNDLETILKGLGEMMNNGFCDGVVWSMKDTARKQLDLTKGWTGDSLQGLSWADLFDGKHRSWLFVEFASQRAILEHSSTILFITHAGPSSANESLYHGVPMVALPIGGDQIQESMRLVCAGVALGLQKNNFQVQHVYDAARRILQDTDGEFHRNVVRLMRIARIAARRKHLAADMVEEFLFDWALRFLQDPVDGSSPNTTLGNGGRGKELSPMHLQTADTRMSRIRAYNLDICFLFVFLPCFLIAGLVVLGVEVSKHVQ